MPLRRHLQADDLVRTLRKGPDPEWVRHLTIKSLGKEDGEFKGAQVPCR